MSLFCGRLLSASAQPATAPLPIHPIRSISPSDSSFADLEFLTQEIGSARVVMLGEPTHGEGTVFEAKVRLMRFLQRRMGFTTVAFESGLYELDLAQRRIEAGTKVQEALESSVFGVWTGTREFQQVLPLLGRRGLRVAGFDYQLSGSYQDELLDELEAFLKPEKGADGIAYDYLDECLSTMGESFLFPPSHQLALFELQLGKARRLLEKVAAGTSPLRQERARFWLQTLRSLQALARDYAHNDPGTKGEAEFKATDSNPRDAQMADNLLWYLRQHPKEKVICWGALPHLSNKAEVLDNAEIQTYRPMGRAVKAALGPDAVYVLGTLAGGGTHGFPNYGGYQPVPAPAVGSLEAELLASGNDYCFVSLKHDAPGRPLTTYAFEYTPFTGPWSEVVDGFLFLKTVAPPHGAVPASTEPEVAAAPAPAPRRPGRPQPAPVLSRPSGQLLMLSGAVADRKTTRPVPFATVAVPGRGVGTVADAQGRFQLAVRRGETLQVSSIGYEPELLPAPGAESPLSVQLAPASFTLANVQVSGRSLDPRRIMKNVIRNATANYEQQQDHAAQVYSRRRLISFDTLRHEVEYLSHILHPAGFREWMGGFLMLGPQETHKVLESHVVVPAPRPLRQADYSQGGHGFYTAGADPVRISPLFKAKTVGRYALTLDSIEHRDGETFYILRFAAKRPSKRVTGMYLTGGYSGRIYVREQDYAVVRYEALWIQDTLMWNSTARKYYGRPVITARLYSQVFSDNRKAHVVTYRKGDNGRYHISTSVAQNLTAGRMLGGNAFYSQASCEEFFSPLPAGAPVPDSVKEPELARGEISQLLQASYRPDFWNSYQRPLPGEPVPSLKASKR
ncbi:hypothetical protein GCM10023185_34920 [Hymenobacter saemangeumensis]|uniref:Erythromycin esterase family protein n=1 Tax=Hymenobacter saemangeumensis TaxID=1084522 RepID=A0ABP8IPT6_9BACT